MVLNMKGNGMMQLIKEMERGTKYGLMDHFTKATGEIIKPMEGVV